MNRRYRSIAIGILVAAFLIPGISAAQNDQRNPFCDWLGWVPDLCDRTVEIEVVATESAVVEQIQRDNPTPEVAGDSDDQSSLPSAEDAKLTQAATSSEPFETPLVTITENGTETQDLKPILSGMLQIMQGIIEVSGTTTVIDDEMVTREYLLKSLDRVYDQIGDSRSDRDGSSSGSSLSFTNPTITGPTLDGVSFVNGSLGIGTSSPSDLLAVDGPIYLGESTPTNTGNRLYNFGGDLYWNGSIVNSSSSANWSAALGDVFRLTGNVGIGTSTPSEALTVDGAALFTGTTTAPLVDAGGQVCDVRAYGAVGDNSTINDAAIAAAIADCGDGGTVYFPMGEFRISTPIVLDRPVTLRGAYSPRWSYSSTPRSSIRADFGSFSGVAMIHVRDRTISGEPDDNNGGRLEYISLDGGSASTNVDGIYFEGLVRDWKLTDVDISQVTGNGFEAAVGTGSGNPRGFTIRGLSIYSADGHGFRATALNDTFIDDLLAVGNALRGIYLSSMGETKVANSRAVFNGLSGLYIDGSSNNGGISFTDFSTDRNDRHGVRISASGTSTIIFNGLLTRRDGPNTSGGSETPYAGLAIIGSTTEKVAPVFVSGLGQTVGVDDVGAPPLSPLTGVRVTNAEYVKIDGQLWGVNEAWRDDGGNDFFIIEDDAILKTGTAGAQELFTSSRKWQSTSTDELIFGNRVHIGSSTDTRLFNIVAPSQAGMRMRDTTNDVTFDMRAEDFQAFFGTFSNHQLRFQTNNTSRLTIDTDGDIGIGTTSAVAALEVWAQNSDDLLNLYDSSNNPLMVVEESGNVGIGTTSPQDTLHVSNGGILLDNNQTVRWYDNSFNIDTILRYDATNDLEIGFGVGNVTQISGQNGIQFRTGIGEVARFNSNGDFGIADTSPDFSLEVATTSALGYFGVTDTTNGDVFIVDAAGDVGIGTESPGERLHVSGGNLLLENTRAIRWQNNSATANTIMAYNSSNGLEIGSGIGGQLELYGNSAMLFHVNGTEYARFDADGDLGFEDTTPDFTVEIASTTASGYFGVTDTADGDLLTVASGGNTGVGTSTPSAQLTVDGTVQFATITGGTLETDALGNVTVSSDERLKDLLGGYEAGLNEVLKLEPILYRWNDESGYEQNTIYAGFSAQNVEDFLPEAVGENGDGFKTLSTRPILASVVNAIQEMWDTVTGNMEKISELENRIESLERALDVQTETEVQQTSDPEPTNTSLNQPKTEEGSGDTATTTEEVVDEDSTADQEQDSSENPPIEEGSEVEPETIEELIEEQENVEEQGLNEEVETTLEEPEI